MSKKLSIALFDIDKTIYRDYSVFEACKFFIKCGILTEDTWQLIEIEFSKYKQGKQNYSFTANEFIKIFANSLQHKKYPDVLAASKEFYRQNIGKFYPYFGIILPLLQKNYDVYIVTTNGQMVAQAVQELFNLEGYLSSDYEVIDGLITGRVLRSLADGKHVVKDLLSQYSGDSMAFGDSDNDVGMLSLVKHPFCFNPNTELLKIATERRWPIITNDTAVTEISKAIKQS